MNAAAWLDRLDPRCSAQLRSAITNLARAQRVDTAAFDRPKLREFNKVLRKLERHVEAEAVADHNERMKVDG